MSVKASQSIRTNFEAVTNSCRCPPNNCHKRLNQGAAFLNHSCSKLRLKLLFDHFQSLLFSPHGFWHGWCNVLQHLSTVWRYKSLWQFFGGKFSIWQNLGPFWAYYVCNWANFHWKKWPNIDKYCRHLVTLLTRVNITPPIGCKFTTTAFQRKRKKKANEKMDAQKERNL